MSNNNETKQEASAETASAPAEEKKPELTEAEIAEKNKRRAERLALIMGPAKE